MAQQSRNGGTVFGYAQTIYNHMKENADRDEETGDLYWTGTVTKVFEEVGINNANYSRVMNALKAMGCIKVKYRGGGAAKMEFWVMSPPNEADYERAREDGALGNNKSLQFHKETRDLNTKVAKLEASLKTVVTAMNSLMARVALLENNGEDMSFLTDEDDWSENV